MRLSTFVAASLLVGSACPVSSAAAQLASDCPRDVTIEALPLGMSPSMDTRDGRTFLTATQYGSVSIAEILPDTVVARATWDVDINLWGSRTLIIDEAVLVFWSAGYLAPPAAFVARLNIETLESEPPQGFLSGHWFTDAARAGNRIIAVGVAANEPRHVVTTISHDGGRSWSTPLQVGPDPWKSSGSAPRLAVCGAHVFIVYGRPHLLGSVEDPVVLCRSEDRGSTWKVLRYLRTPDVGYTCVRVGCRESTVVIAGSSFPHVNAIASLDAGETWSQPLSNIHPTIDHFKCPEVAIDRTGTWHLVGFSNVVPDWDEGHGDLLHLASDDGGKTWSPPDELNCNTRAARRVTRHFDLSVTLSGDRLYAAYQSALLRPVVRLAWRGDLPAQPPVPAFDASPVRNPATSQGTIEIRVTLPISVALTHDVFDAAGRRVATWKTRTAGPGSVVVAWNGRSADGSRSASGVYFWRVRTGSTRESATVRVVLI